MTESTDEALAEKLEGYAKSYAVKLRGFPPCTVQARNASAAKYANAKMAVEAGYGRNAMSMAWHDTEWVRRILPQAKEQPDVQS